MGNLLVLGNFFPLKALSTHEEEDNIAKANCIVPQEYINHCRGPTLWPASGAVVSFASGMSVSLAL